MRTALRIDRLKIGWIAARTTNDLRQINAAKLGEAIMDRFGEMAFQSPALGEAERKMTRASSSIVWP